MGSAIKNEHGNPERLEEAEKVNHQSPWHPPRPTRHGSLLIRHSPFAIRHSSFVIRHSSFSPAFTLVELLVVISIIAVIMGLLVGLITTAGRTMRLKRVEGELQNYVTAIENYKAKNGFFPPDNVEGTDALGRKIVLPAPNQLYYELTGWTYSEVRNGLQPLTRNGPLYTNTVQRFFHTLGFMNASANLKEQPPSFLPNLKPASQVGQIASGTTPMVDVLIVPVKGPRDITEFRPDGKPSGRSLNLWRYVSSAPTNNPGSFDLWAEIVIGRETKIIGNWKE